MRLESLLCRLLYDLHSSHRFDIIYGCVQSYSIANKVFAKDDEDHKGRAEAAQLSALLKLRALRLGLWS